MVNDPLRELLTSPLDDKPARRRSAGDTPHDGSRLWPWLPVAMLAGGALVLAGYLVGGDRTDRAVTTTMAGPTTSTTLAPVGPQIPPGYTAVGDRVGMRVERILVHQGVVFVTLSQVVANTLASGESAGIGAGRWELGLRDGRTVTAIEESLSFLTPGFRSVRFVIPDVTRDDITGITLTGLGFDADTSVQTRVEAIALPDDGSPVTVAFTPDRFELEPGVVLQISDLTISAEQGDLTWTLSGDNPDALARASLYLELTSDEGTSGANTRTAASNDAFTLPSFRPSERSGRVLFDPQSPAGFDPAVTSLTLHLDITWTTYQPLRIALGMPGG